MFIVSFISSLPSSIPDIENVWLKLDPIFGKVTIIFLLESKFTLAPTNEEDSVPIFSLPEFIKEFVSIVNIAPLTSRGLLFLRTYPKEIVL